MASLRRVADEAPQAAERRIEFRICSKAKPRPVLVRSPFCHDSSLESSETEAEDECETREPPVPKKSLPPEPPPHQEPPSTPESKSLHRRKPPLLDENGNRASRPASWDDDLQLESLDAALKKETEKIGQWDLDEMEVLSVWQPEESESEEPEPAPPLPDYSPTPPPPPPPGGGGCDEDSGPPVSENGSDTAVVDMVLSAGEDGDDEVPADLEAVDGFSDDLNESIASTLSRKSVQTVDGQSPHRDLTRPPTRSPSPLELLFGETSSRGSSCSPARRRRERGRRNRSRSRSRSPSWTRNPWQRDRGREPRRGRLRSPWSSRGRKRGRSSSSSRSSSLSSPARWPYKPCNLCLVHGELSRYSSAHKFKCLYYSCCCEGCITNILRLVHREGQQSRFLQDADQIMTEIRLGMKDAMKPALGRPDVCLYCVNHNQAAEMSRAHLARCSADRHCGCVLCLRSTVRLRSRAATKQRARNCVDCRRHGVLVEDGALHSMTCRHRNCDDMKCCGDRVEVRREAQEKFGILAVTPRKSRWDQTSRVATATTTAVNNEDDSWRARDPRLVKKARVEVRDGVARRDPHLKPDVKDPRMKKDVTDPRLKQVVKDLRLKPDVKNSRMKLDDMDPRMKEDVTDPRNKQNVQDPRMKQDVKGPLLKQDVNEDSRMKQDGEPDRRAKERPTVICRTAPLKEERMVAKESLEKRPAPAVAMALASSSKRTALPKVDFAAILLRSSAPSVSDESAAPTGGSVNAPLGTMSVDEESLSPRSLPRDGDASVPDAPPPPVISAPPTMKMIVSEGDLDDIACKIRHALDGSNPNPPTPDPPEPPTPDPPAPPSPDPPTPAIVEAAVGRALSVSEAPGPSATVAARAAPDSELPQLAAKEREDAEHPVSPAVAVPAYELVHVKQEVVEEEEVAPEAEDESVDAICAFLEQPEAESPQPAVIAINNISDADLHELLGSLIEELPDVELDSESRSPGEPTPAPTEDMEPTPSLPPPTLVPAACAVPPAVPLPLDQDQEDPASPSAAGRAMPVLVPMHRAEAISQGKCSSATPASATHMSAGPPAATPIPAGPISATPPSVILTPAAVPALPGTATSGMPAALPLFTKPMSSSSVINSSNHASRSPLSRSERKLKLNESSRKTATNAVLKKKPGALCDTSPNASRSTALTSRGRVPRKCKLCRNHNVSALMRGEHKRYCVHKDCPCEPCQVTRKHRLEARQRHDLLRQTGSCVLRKTDLKCGETKKSCTYKITNSSSDDSDLGTRNQSAVRLEECQRVTDSNVVVFMDSYVSADLEEDNENEEDDMPSDSLVIDESVVAATPEDSDEVVVEPKKQEAIERIYGPSQLAQGVASLSVSPKRSSVSTSPKRRRARACSNTDENLSKDRKAKVNYCGFCRNHGRVQKLRGHQKQCSFKMRCPCDACVARRLGPPTNRVSGTVRGRGRQRGARGLPGRPRKHKSPVISDSDSDVQLPRMRKPKNAVESTDSESSNGTEDDLDSIPLGRRIKLQWRKLQFLKSLKRQHSMPKCSEAGERSPESKDLTDVVSPSESSEETSSERRQAIDLLLAAALFSENVEPDTMTPDKPRIESKSNLCSVELQTIQPTLQAVPVLQTDQLDFCPISAKLQQETTPVVPPAPTERQTSNLKEMSANDCGNNVDCCEESKSDQEIAASTAQLENLTDNTVLELVTKRSVEMAPFVRRPRPVLLPPIRIPEITAPRDPGFVTPIANASKEDQLTPIDLSVGGSAPGPSLPSPTTPTLPTSPVDLSIRTDESLPLELVHRSSSVTETSTAPTPTASALLEGSLESGEPLPATSASAASPPVTSASAAPSPVISASAASPPVISASGAPPPVTSAFFAPLPETHASVFRSSSGPTCVIQISPYATATPSIPRAPSAPRPFLLLSSAPVAAGRPSSAPVPTRAEAPSAPRPRPPSAPPTASLTAVAPTPRAVPATEAPGPPRATTTAFVEPRPDQRAGAGPKPTAHGVVPVPRGLSQAPFVRPLRPGPRPKNADQELRVKLLQRRSLGYGVASAGALAAAGLATHIPATSTAGTTSASSLPCSGASMSGKSPPSTAATTLASSAHIISATLFSTARTLQPSSAAAIAAVASRSSGNATTAPPMLAAALVAPATRPARRNAPDQRPSATATMMMKATGGHAPGTPSSDCRVDVPWFSASRSAAHHGQPALPRPAPQPEPFLPELVDLEDELELGAHARAPSGISPQHGAPQRPQPPCAPAPEAAWRRSAALTPALPAPPAPRPPRPSATLTSWAPACTPEQMSALGLVPSPPPSPSAYTPPSTPSPTILELHEGGEVAFPCDDCELVFASELERSEHRLAQHTGGQEYPCCHCTVISWSRQQADFHTATVHRPPVQEQFRCASCAACFPSQVMLTTHLMTMAQHGDHRHPPAPSTEVSCPVCRLLLDSPRQLSTHVQNAHVTATPFECDHPGCRVALKSPMSLQTHRATHVVENAQQRCPICVLPYGTRAMLDAHWVTEHPGPYPFVCPICSKSLRTMSGLSNHVKRKHGHTKPFACRERGCGETFHSPRKLLEHVSQSRHMTLPPHELGRQGVWRPSVPADVDSASQLHCRHPDCSAIFPDWFSLQDHYDVDHIGLIPVARASQIMSFLPDVVRARVLNQRGSGQSATQSYRHAQAPSHDPRQAIVYPPVSSQSYSQGSQSLSFPVDCVSSSPPLSARNPFEF